MLGIVRVGRLLMGGDWVLLLFGWLMKVRFDRYFMVLVVSRLMVILDMMWLMLNVIVVSVCSRLLRVLNVMLVVRLVYGFYW